MLTITTCQMITSVRCEKALLQPYNYRQVPEYVRSNLHDQRRVVNNPQSCTTLHNSAQPCTKSSPIYSLPKNHEPTNPPTYNSTLQPPPTRHTLHTKPGPTPRNPPNPSIWHPANKPSACNHASAVAGRRSQRATSAPLCRS